MGQWGSEYFSVRNALQNAVRALPENVVDAFLFAIDNRTTAIKRGTWDGCAFNAAGQDVLGENIDSITRASRLFNTTDGIVRRFITAWDSSISHIQDDAAATKLLRDYLMSKKFDSPHTKRQYSITVYEGYEKRFDNIKFEEAVDIEQACQAFYLLFERTPA